MNQDEKRMEMSAYLECDRIGVRILEVERL